MDTSSQSSNLSEQAINAALSSNWELALKLNKQILKVDPQNVDALNRLARTYLELGKCNLAKKYYSEVVKIDSYNPIALKNLKMIKSFKSNAQNTTLVNKNGLSVKDGNLPNYKLSPSLFLQEPGKTKTVNLLKVAEPQKLSQAFCGMQVEMAIKNRRITIVDANGNYLGVLPDDVSHHLTRLFKGGNKYELFIKSIRVNSLSVIIKETFRSKKFKNQPSFLEFSNSSVSTNMLTSFDTEKDDENSDEEEEN